MKIKLSFWDVGLAAIALIISALYVYNWTIFFNSDYALIGLIGKRIAETGEQFIFIPTIGYQGLLIEGNIVALFFKLWDVSPYSLHTAAAFLALLFYIVLYQTVKIWYNSFTARLTVLLCLLSYPGWLGQFHRTQPNYAETFTMGCLLFILYYKIFNRNKTNKSEILYLHLGLFGFISGFGLYTYGQIVYFLGAIFVFTVYNFYVKPLKPKGLQSYFRWLFFPTVFLENARPFIVKINKTIGYFALSFIILGIGCTVFQTEEIKIVINGIKIAWQAFDPLIDGFLLLFVIHLLNAAAYFLPVLTTHQKLNSVRLSGLVFGTFLIGYSPKIYYNKILGLHSLTHNNIIKFPSELTHNIEVLFQGQTKFFNLELLPPLGWGALLLAVFALFYYLRNAESSPFTFLVPMVIGIFCISKNVIDLHSIRYAILLIVCFSIAIAYLVQNINKIFPKNNIKKWILAILFISVFHRSYALLNNLQNAPPDYEKADVADVLQNENIKYGYSSYWEAYIINFCTNEEIILEPLGSNYLPFYAAPVKAADRIAMVIDPVHYPLPQDTLQPVVRDVKYQTEKYFRYKHLHIFILNKIK